MEENRRQVNKQTRIYISQETNDLLFKEKETKIEEKKKRKRNRNAKV